MAADRIWKWAERAAVVVIAPLCAIAGAYFAAGTYYGWDKQAATHAGGQAMTLPPWLGLALLGIAIVSLLTGWCMIFIRWRPKKSKASNDDSAPAVPSIYEVYSADPEGEALDKAAYNQLVAFCIDNLLPACQAQIELQEAMVNHLCNNWKVAELALTGMRDEKRFKTGEFWKNYWNLSSGLTDSPGPTIKFDGMIEYISELEREFYKNFCEQAPEIAAAGGLKPNAPVFYGELV
jgi:hypothetical protein